MKVTLDLDELLESGRIDASEYAKFSALSARSTTNLAFNLMLGFGVAAVSGAALALLPQPDLTAIPLGLALLAAGLVVKFARWQQWTVLATICLVVGALIFAGGVIVAAQGSMAAFWLVALVLAAVGVAARSALLMVLAVLSLASSIGARTGYLHAMYFLGIEEPTVTVVLFTLLATLAWWLSRRMGGDHRRLAGVAARTCVFLVNFGFWIGSLWGDRLDTATVVVAPWVFAVLWAVALVAAGVWAWRRDRRWLVNVVAVFAAIHFYTQWFEYLDATPATVLAAGLLALAFALGWRHLNRAAPTPA